MPVYPENLLTPEREAEAAFNQRGWIAEEVAKMGPGYRDEPLFRIASRLRRDGYTAEDAVALLQPMCDSVGATYKLQDKIAAVWRKYEAEAKPTVDGGLDKTEGFASFMETEERVSWLVPGAVPAKAFGYVAGLPETCKTWLMMDLAVELARGGVWLGTRQTNKAKVLFIDQERFAGETRRRFRALLKAKKLNYRELAGNLDVWCGTSIRLDMQPSYEAFRARLLQMRPDLVVVDSFATFHTKEENSRKESQEVIEKIKSLRQEIGCTFIFIDHENKGVFQADEDEAPSAMRLAGSVAKVAAAEFCFTVRAKGKNRSAVYATKSTLGPALDPFFVEVNDVDGDPTQIEVVAK